jgi:hypothetical protein
MLTNALLISGSSGILSALTFLFSVMQGTVLLIYLPILPILLVGFHFGFKKAVIAALTAAVLLMMVNTASVTGLYILFLAIPALIVSFFTLQRKHGGEWYPVMRLITNLLIYAAAMIAIVVFDYSDVDGGLQAKIASELSPTYEGLDPNLTAMMQDLLGKHAYFLIASTSWLWVMMVYLMALVAHYILDSYRQNIRPSFSLKEGEMSTWMLPLLGVASVVAFASSGEWQFASRAAMLMLLLPYFIAGLIAIHRKSAHLPGRGFLLTVLYAIIFITAWPILFVAMFGVMLQLQKIGKPTNTAHS